MLSQGSKWGDHCTVYRWAEQQLVPQRTAFIVHRLDRAASGLIMLAHSKRMAKQLSMLFQQRQIEKHYHVWVQGHCQQAQRIDIPLANKAARSHIKLLQYNAANNSSHLEVHIETGRKHQIRQHLAHIGFPVVGDRLYGRDNQDQDLQLRAYSLRFICPITQTERYFQLAD
jgi:tRNA pseudouridine32 synthase/23S rRNA pseudouridine746 synthase